MRAAYAAFERAVESKTPPQPGNPFLNAPQEHWIKTKPRGKLDLTSFWAELDDVLGH